MVQEKAPGIFLLCLIHLCFPSRVWVHSKNAHRTKNLSASRFKAEQAEQSESWVPCRVLMEGWKKRGAEDRRVGCHVVPFLDCRDHSGEGKHPSSVVRVVLLGWAPLIYITCWRTNIWPQECVQLCKESSVMMPGREAERGFHLLAHKDMTDHARGAPKNPDRLIQGQSDISTITTCVIFIICR